MQYRKEPRLNTITTIIVAVLVFGFLIFIHEFGHYITARIFHVTIQEFSIGMGPRLAWFDSKKTGIRYSLAMLPIGGYVSMNGEMEETDDPNAFDKKPAWQRFIITAAGAFINLVAGLLIMTIFAASTSVNLGTTIVADFPESEYEVSSEDYGLTSGDEILRIDGKRVRFPDELSYEIMRRGNEPIDIVIRRDGKEMTLTGVVFPVLEEQGQSFGMMDFRVYAKEKTFGGTLSYAFSKSALTVRMVWESLYDLITGRYSFGAVSGPVGISGALGDAASAGIAPLLSLVALISINLGVMNLLPLPALDGGRLLTIAIEMITRKKLPTKVEGIVNAVGLILLLGLSFVILIKDIVQIFI